MIYIYGSVGIHLSFPLAVALLISVCNVDRGMSESHVYVPELMLYDEMET